MIKKTCLLIITFVILSSCASSLVNFALKSVGVFDATSNLKTLTNNQKKVIFIGMHHIGKKEFYDDISNKIDSLQKLEYIVFYESVTDHSDIDSLVSVISAMKLRKIMGYVPKKHLDTTTNMIGGKIEYKEKHKLINQPKYSELNVDSLTSIKADVNLTDLISAYEKKHSEIKLDSCDYTFKLKDNTYDCEKTDKEVNKTFGEEYIVDYRNKYLAEQVIKINNDSIVIIYGKNHFEGLVSELQISDKNWREVE